MELKENAGKEREIFFVKQEGSIVAYEFDVNTKRLKKQNIDELAKQSIVDIHVFGKDFIENKEKRTIRNVICKLQKECEVPEH